MGGFQMRVSCLVLLTVHQVTGIVMTTFATDLKKKKMKRSGIDPPSGTSYTPVGATSTNTGGAATSSVSGGATSTNTGGAAGATSTNTGGASTDESVSINMGGAARHDDNTNVYRPEAVHSEVCDTSLQSKACTPCTSIAGCWHGVDPNALGISVPEGKVGFEYLASIWASCTKDQGYWRVSVEEVKNANIGVYLNDNAVTKTTIGTDLYGKKDQYEITHEMVGENARIKIILSPKSGGSSLSQDSGGEATAKITIYAMANSFVDACMDRNFCLKKLGDGSATAFELRNSNLRQYQCLQGNPIARLETVCNAWRACFASQTGTSYEAELKKFLKVVFEKAPTNLVQTKLLGISSSEQVDEEDCVDPETADAESAECECFAMLKKKCDADEECFKSYLCEHAKVCQSWKDDSGCDSSLLMRRGSRGSSTAIRANGTRSSMAITAHGTLDGSLTGKCTSSTRQ